MINESAIEEAFAEEETEETQDESQEAEGQEAEAAETEAADTGEEIDPAMQQALDRGWVPRDEWDGDPEDWKGYKAFNKDGELIGTLKAQKAEIGQLKSTMSESLARNNLFYKTQIDTLKREIANKEKDFDNAVDLADKDQAKELRQEIDEKKAQLGQMHQQTTHTAHPSSADLVNQLATHPTLVAWRAKNDWIENTDDPRTQKASQAFAERFTARAKDFSNLDALVDDCIAHVESVAKPQRNTNREKPGVSAGGGKASAGSSGKLGWGNLTAEEKAIYSEFSDQWTKDEYLKVVEESRV